MSHCRHKFKENQIVNMILVQTLHTKTMGIALTALAGKAVLLQLLVDPAW